MAKIVSLIFIVILLTMVNGFAEDKVYHGYVKHDLQLEGIQLDMFKGEEIECEIISNGKCCIETHVGRGCVNLGDLSSEKIRPVDLYLDKVKYTDDSLAKSDVCAEGKSINMDSDAFKWSYGFHVNSSEKVREEVIVEATHIPVHNGLPIYTLGFTKLWKGRPDGKCHSIVITKKDIDGFISAYAKLSEYLDIETDLNIEVLFSLRLINKRYEENYDNNSFELETILPADSSATWPPSELDIE